MKSLDRRRLLVGVALAGLVALLPVRTASAHVSDFGTLTLDLLLSPRGLVIVDAALVTAPGPSYQPFPSESARREVAARVLEALGVGSQEGVTDTAMSERYHEVGFTIRLRRPFANSGTAGIHVGTRTLQRIAAAAHVKRLKLEVCESSASDVVVDHASTAGSSTPPKLTLRVRATTPGRAADRLRNERPGCEIWVLGVGDASVSVNVGVAPATLATTGSDHRPPAAAAVLVAVGLSLIALTRRWGDVRIIPGAYPR